LFSLVSILKLGPLKAILSSSIGPNPKSTVMFVLSTIFSDTLNLSAVVIDEVKVHII